MLRLICVGEITVAMTTTNFPTSVGYTSVSPPKVVGDKYRVAPGVDQDQLGQVTSPDVAMVTGDPAMQAIVAQPMASVCGSPSAQAKPARPSGIAKAACPASKSFAAVSCKTGPWTISRRKRTTLWLMPSRPSAPSAPSAPALAISAHAFVTPGLVFVEGTTQTHDEPPLVATTPFW